MRTFYEVEQAINKKADQWELQNVKNENDWLKNQIQELEKLINGQASVTQVLTSKIDQLLEVLIASELIEDDSQLHNIKNQY